MGFYTLVAYLNESQLRVNKMTNQMFSFALTFGMPAWLMGNAINVLSFCVI